MNKSTYKNVRLLHILTIGGVGVLTVFLWVLLGHSYPNKLMINEVSFNNNDGADWIEIYNPSLSSVSIRGYYLSDNDSQLTKFKITDDIVVPRHGYIVFYGQQVTDAGEGIQLPFNIKNGETIYLVDSDGATILDRLTVLKADDDAASTSVGRFPDGSTNTFTFTMSTPGAQNKKEPLDALIEAQL